MSVKESDLKVLNVRKGGLSGRCQRVSTLPESEGSENVVPHKQVSSTELLQLIDCPAEETNNKKKPNLSKYIDDNIRNFDLLKKRNDRNHPSSDSTTNSNGSTNSSFEKDTTRNISTSNAKENVDTNKQAEQPTVKSVPAPVTTSTVAVETPSKRSKSRASKFSIDAVESPKAAAPVAAPALASVLARSSSILARTKKAPPTQAAVSAVPAAVIVQKNEAVVAEAPARSISESQSGLYWHDSEVPARTTNQPIFTAAADLTTGSNNNTATNTNAPTVAFKKTSSVSEVSRPALTEPAVDSGDAKHRKVSFIAPTNSTASASSSVNASDLAVAPSSHSKSARKSVTGTTESVSSGSRATPSRTPSHASTASAPASTAVAVSQPAGTYNSSAAPAAGILGDPARTVELNGKHYIRLNVLGKGGSSCVYRIIGAEDGQIYAYKRVEVKESEDMDAVFDNYANEIALLRRLSSSAQLTASGEESGAQGGAESSAVVASVTGAQSRIIELVDFEVRRDQRYIAMILEAGDIDLAKVLQQKNTARSNNSAGLSSGTSSGVNSDGPQHILDPFFARMVWREMLEAVDHIHQHRIVHGDLKPANFVFVKGHLKLIDFGIAKSFTSDTTNIYRESQIGTINYMAPEAIAPMSSDDGHATSDRLKMRLGRASDIWSLGCILYQMVYGRPPFAALNTIQKLSTIPNPKHVIKYADWGDADAVDSMQACLKHDARLRSKIRGPEGLLERAYLQVPANIQRSVGSAGYKAAASSSATASIGKEQVQCIVGAVLDSLSNVAQEAVAKAQATKGRGTRNTRSGGRSADAEAAEKMAQGIVKWIDEVDQEGIEGEVMEVVLEQDWALAPTVPVSLAVPAPAAPVTAPAAVPVPMQQVKVPVPVPAPVQVTAPVHALVAAVLDPVLPTTKAVLPAPTPVVAAKEAAPTPSKKASASKAAALASPSPSRKRKADDAPGSTTRSASKRVTLSSAMKAAAEDPKEVTNSVPFSAKKHIPAYTVASSPRTLTAKPAFLSNILGAPKLAAFPLKSATVTAAATSSGAASSSSSTGNNITAPKKALPLSLQQEIQNSAARRSSLSAAAEAGAGAPVVDRAARWMRQAPREEHMLSDMEKRIGALRKFMNCDDDNDTATETMDITGFF